MIEVYGRGIALLRPREWKSYLQLVVVEWRSTPIVALIWPF
jgi:hypothetical protein